MTFHWEFNETANGAVDGIQISKKDQSADFILSWHEGRAILDPKVVKTYKNAGMVLLNVQIHQSGIYESSIYFTNLKQLHNKSNFTVKTGIHTLHFHIAFDFLEYKTYNILLHGL